MFVKMRWTQEQLDEYMYRTSDTAGDETEPDPGPESSLSGKITKWAKDHGYPCQCFRQSRKARGFTVPGWPD